MANTYNKKEPVTWENLYDRNNDYEKEVNKRTAELDEGSQRERRETYRERMKRRNENFKKLLQKGEENAMNRNEHARKIVEEENRKAEKVQRLAKLGISLVRLISGDLTQIPKLIKDPYFLGLIVISSCINIVCILMLIFMPILTTAAAVSAVKDEMIHAVTEAVETGGCVVALASPGTYIGDAVGIPGVDGLVGTCFDQLGIAELDKRLGVTSTIRSAIPDFGKVPKVKKPSWLKL